MTIKRCTLRRDVASRIGELQTGYVVDSSGATSLVDAARIEPDGYWANFFIEAYASDKEAGDGTGEVRLVTAFAQATGTFTVSPAWTSNPAADSLFALWPVNPDRIDYVITEAVRRTWPKWWKLVVDETTLDTAADTYEYALPAAAERLLSVYLLDSGSTARVPPPSWRVVGPATVKELVFATEPASGCDIGLTYIAIATLGTTATSVLDLGGAGASTADSEACAAFIVAQATHTYLMQRYRKFGQEEDWNIMRVLAAELEQLRRRGMTMPSSDLQSYNRLDRQTQGAMQKLGAVK